METADLRITGAQTLDVLSGELIDVPLAIAGDRILGFGDYPCAITLDLPGQVLLPGFWDGHLHLESSMLLPGQFAAAAVPHGTVGVVADPHEIANVCGLSGARYLLDNTPHELLDVRVMAPSCVPATPFETAGAEITVADITEMLKWPEVLGLGEVMNCPGVINRDPVMLAKLAAALGKPIDGHAPGLTGAALEAYVAAGPESDHEATTLEEGAEKLAAGMWLMIREGSASRNLQALASLLRGDKRDRCLLVSDDLDAHDLVYRGHLDYLLSQAVRLGVAPLDAVRGVSANVAARFGLLGHGALAPGYVADLVAVSDLASFKVNAVVKSGKLVVQNGKLLAPVQADSQPLPCTCHVPRLDPDVFLVAAPDAAEQARVRVIVAFDGAIVTGSAEATLRVNGGCVLPDAAQDVLALAVLERHGRNGNVGRGFIRGFGLKAGALASTVAHDSHNLLVIGADAVSMATAARAVVAAGGGQAAAVGDKVLNLLPLPVAGLVSTMSAAEVAASTAKLESAARQLGCALSHPFMTLSFMALPVIPELKLTDRGLFDVGRFGHMPALCE
ncbi:MAG: adenine deaminase [Armatimonadia bacterium]